MAFAALAILGHRSAHSLPIGPVIADPARIIENMTSYHASSTTVASNAI
jgi:hypothetical protein